MSLLATGKLPYVPITAKVVPAPYPSGKCPQSLDDLSKWFKTFSVEFHFEQVAFAYTSGPFKDAPVSSRTLPRLLFDSRERFMGLGVWNPDLGGWETGARLGQLMTIYRSESTLDEDLEAKNLNNSGWHLADGNSPSLPDLKANEAFFKGSAPNYEYYTVGYTGA